MDPPTFSHVACSVACVVGGITWSVFGFDHASHTHFLDGTRPKDHWYSVSRIIGTGSQGNKDLVSTRGDLVQVFLPIPLLLALFMFR